MNLTQDDIKTVVTISSAAKALGVPAVSIEEEIVRGVDLDRTVVIHKSEDVIPLSCGDLGIGDVNIFASRFDIANKVGDFNVVAEVSENGGFVRSLKLKAKGLNIDYRCSNPSDIIAPRKLNDQMVAKATFTQEAINLLDQGKKAMKADVVTIISNKRGVSFEFADVSNDLFQYSFGDAAESYGDNEEDGHFVYRYPIDKILAVTKLGSTIFEVGKKGMMKFNVDGFDVYIVPRV